MSLLTSPDVLPSPHGLSSPAHHPTISLPHTPIHTTDDLCRAVSSYPELSRTIYSYYIGEPFFLRCIDVAVLEIKSIVDRATRHSNGKLSWEKKGPSLTDDQISELEALHVDLCEEAKAQGMAFALREVLRRFHEVFEYYYYGGRLGQFRSGRLIFLACQNNLLPLIQSHPDLLEELKSRGSLNTTFPPMHIIFDPIGRYSNPDPRLHDTQSCYLTLLETLGMYQMTHIRSVSDPAFHPAWWGLPWEEWTSTHEPERTKRVTLGDVVVGKPVRPGLEHVGFTMWQSRKEIRKSKEGHGMRWMI